jgi:antirestriction protein ArdC
MAKFDWVLEKMQARLLERIEQNPGAWKRPWSELLRGGHYNALTGREYSWSNGIACEVARLAEGWTSTRWLGRQQILDLGASWKGQGTALTWWIPAETREVENDDGTTSTAVTGWRGGVTWVWNLDQVTGLSDEAKARLVPKVENPKVHDPIGAAEAVADGYVDGPSIVDAPRAYYRPSTDEVGRPPLEAFDRPEEYYRTLFHELVHSTGHTKRLARPEITERIDFGSESYSREELVAEVGAAFLAGHAGIEDDKTDGNSAAYLCNWLPALRKDSSLLGTACQQARKAAGRILGAKA